MATLLQIVSSATPEEKTQFLAALTPEVQPSSVEVRPTEVRPSEVQPSSVEVRPTEVRPTEVQPSVEVRPIITRFMRTDILKSCNDVERLGFDKNRTEEEMIQLAIQHKCKIIVKAGKNAKWYLKGQVQSTVSLKSKIEANVGREADGVYCLLLEW